MIVDFFSRVMVVLVKNERKKKKKGIKVLSVLLNLMSAILWDLKIVIKLNFTKNVYNFMMMLFFFSQER